MDNCIRGDSVAQWKTAMTGDPHASFLWVDNAEESADLGPPASRPGTAMPARPATSATHYYSTRMAWLVETNDVLLRSEPLNPDFARYVEQIRSVSLKTLVLPTRAEPLPLTQAAKRDKDAIRAFSMMKAENVYLYPNTYTRDIDALSQFTGLSVVGTRQLGTYARLNNKCKNREIAREAGIRQIPGAECGTVSALRNALQSSASLTFPMLAKEANSSGGSNITVIDNESTAAAFLRRFAAQPDDTPLSYVVESYIDKDHDVFYQMIIDRTGHVTLTDVKRFQTLPGGFNSVSHDKPHGLKDHHLSELHDAAMKIGAALFRDGFHGVAGVDALLARDGTLFPMVEVNPRLNSTSFHTALLDQFPHPFMHNTFQCIQVRAGNADFSDILEAFRDVPAPSNPDGGVIITAFSVRRSLTDTMTEQPGLARIRTMVLAPTSARMALLGDAVVAATQRFADRASAVRVADHPPATAVTEGV